MMEKVFISALEKLTEPLAIISVVLMFVIVILVLTVTRTLPKIHSVLGQHTALMEIMVFGRGKNGSCKKDS